MKETMIWFHFISKIQRDLFTWRLSWKFSLIRNLRLFTCLTFMWNPSYCCLMFPWRAAPISVVNGLNSYSLQIKWTSSCLVRMLWRQNGGQLGWTESAFSACICNGNEIRAWGRQCKGWGWVWGGESQILILYCMEFKPWWLACRLCFYILIYGSTNLRPAPTSLLHQALIFPNLFFLL